MDEVFGKETWVHDRTFWGETFPWFEFYGEVSVRDGVFWAETFPWMEFFGRKYSLGIALVRTFIEHP